MNKYNIGNREIKFRAFAEGVMWEYRALAMIDGRIVCGVWNCEETDIVREYTDTIIMQFTGLLDKNGKEIYEGDIVKRNIRPCFGDDREEIKVVEYDIFNGYVLSGNNVWHLGIYAGKHKQNSIEVIGNIFENPELLKS